MRHIEPSLNPPDYDDGVTELQEEVGKVLEDNLLPSMLNDQIIELVAFHERQDPMPEHSYAFHLSLRLRSLADKLEERSKDRRCHMCRVTNMTACHHTNHL